MKVLFLDIDGVLNSKQHFLMVPELKSKSNAKTLEAADLFRMKQDVNTNNMWVLGYILKNVPDLKIVISSAWGKFYKLEQFKELFKIYKLDETRLIGITPRKMSSYRCNEIRWWLEENAPLAGELIQWLALDDHAIFELDEDEKRNEHLTDSWVGVTMNDAFKIIRHFDHKFNLPLLLI